MLDLKYLLNKKTALAFSGGLDSSYLLYCAKIQNIDITAYYVHSQFQPLFELKNAERFAKEHDVKLCIIECDILSTEEIIKNSEDRCYHCKKKLFSTIMDTAQTEGCTVTLDGTNASDDPNKRPGMKAIEDLGVISPLKDSGLTKNNIRELSKKENLSSWNLDSYSCLATRIPTGTKILKNDLIRVEKSENILYNMGFRDFRVRINNENANVHVHSEQIDNATMSENNVKTALSNEHNTITIEKRCTDGS